jgi:hypothetical protein
MRHSPPPDRRGREYAGWCPLPPDEILVEYRERPDFWIFVRQADLIAPSIVNVILRRRYASEASMP